MTADTFTIGERYRIDAQTSIAFWTLDGIVADINHDRDAVCLVQWQALVTIQKDGQDRHMNVHGDGLWLPLDTIIHSERHTNP